jgi:hypothetical protein
MIVDKYGNYGWDALRWQIPAHTEWSSVHDCFKYAEGQDIFLLDWHQVLSYDVSLLNIRLVVNFFIDLCSAIQL